MKYMAIVFMAFIGVSTAWTPVCAADARYPDWPCKQLKVPELSPAAIWSGPPIGDAGNTWEQVPGLTDLVARLAARRTPIEEAEKQIDKYLTGTEAEKQEKAKMLFAGLLASLNGQRNQVMAGLERAYRREKELAQTIRLNTAKMRELQDAGEKDQAKLDALGRQIEWDTRIFEDRRKSMNYACDVPVQIEQRLFALGRAIQNSL
jgi:hypothetical protein